MKIDQLELFDFYPPAVSVENKSCYSCGETLPLSKFRVLVKRHGDRHTMSSTCCDCDDKAERLKKEYRRTNPLPENFKCPLCGRSHEDYKETGRYFTQSPFSVDHCQKRMEVRGWICNPCNSSMGLAQHNSLLLRKMADYLES